MLSKSWSFLHCPTLKTESSPPVEASNMWINQELNKQMVLWVVLVDPLLCKSSSCRGPNCAVPMSEDWNIPEFEDDALHSCKVDRNQNYLIQGRRQELLTSTCDLYSLRRKSSNPCSVNRCNLIGTEFCLAFLSEHAKTVATTFFCT